MCGRYTLAMPLLEVVDLLFLHSPEFALAPRYNIAPTQRLPVITNESPEELQLYRWGLVPSWAKDPSIGNRMINARGETIHQKPSFRNAFKRKRCLVLADGFYEWKKTPT
ncbi:MAG: SOS response-associated peptidase, partial [Bacteroidota bacterium]